MTTPVRVPSIGQVDLIEIRFKVIVNFINVLGVKDVDSENEYDISSRLKWEGILLMHFALNTLRLQLRKKYLVV